MQAQAATATADQPRRRLRFPVVELTAILVIALLLLACFARGRGVKTWVVRQFYPAYKARPTVVSMHPRDFESKVPLDAFVACEVALPNEGRTVDPRTLPPQRPDTVRLVRMGDRKPVPANVNTTGAGDAIVLQPLERLQPNTQYSFEVTPGVTDTGGSPFVYFSARFTTAAAVTPESFAAAFEKVPLPTATGASPSDMTHVFTCVTVGPDHRLYASTADGRILRFAINPDDGTLSAPATLPGILANNDGPRLVIGICFDPAATADDLVLWVSHGQLAFQQSHDWTGKISRLSGPDLKTYRDVIVHLPRAMKDHLNNQPVFGPDGALYFAQASNTAMGAPDKVWGWRPERLLSAAVLRLDVNKALAAEGPIDVKTEDGHAYDPYAPDAPLTIHATGIRNSYDLLFHSNGKLYAPINGSAAGGNAPASTDPRGESARRIDTGKPYDGPSIPGLEQIQQPEEDNLLIVEAGGYYGHPNPLRGEFVLNGGNPTEGKDLCEVAAYPVGTRPDANYRYPAFSFGRHLSPDGVIEYKSPGPLAGRTLVTRFSGGDDVIVLTTDPRSGAITESITGIDGLTGFSDPLDITQDPRNGNLYISEYGSKRLTLVRPIKGGVSNRVYRQVIPQAQHATAE